MVNPVKIATNAPVEMVKGATNFKLIGGVVVGVFIGTLVTGLIFHKFRNNDIIKKANDGLN